MTDACLSNIEAEQALLGALLVRNDVLGIACDGLLPEHFSEAVHARIYEAAATIIRSGKLASPVTLKSHFERDETLHDIGGTVYLARLARAAVSIVNAPSYADIIRDLALKRAGVAILEDAAAAARDLPIDQSASEFLSSVATEISKVSEGAERQASTVTVARAASVALDSAAEAFRLGGRRPGAVSTGLRTLDDLIGGFVPGNLVIIGGRPSMGKSALAVSFAWNCATAGRPALFVSLEMTSEQLASRFLSLHSGVAYSRIEQGRFAEHEFQAMTRARDDMANFPLIIDDRSNATPGDVGALIARTKRKHPSLALVVIDYLGLLSAGDRYRGRKVDELGEMTAELKRCAKRQGVPVVLLCQLSRGPDSRENKRAGLADLRDSGSIEQDADVIAFPYREEYYLSRALDAALPGSSQEIEISDRLRDCRGIMEIGVAKNRQGPTGTARVSCDMATNRITDPEERMQAAA